MDAVYPTTDYITDIVGTNHRIEDDFIYIDDDYLINVVKMSLDNYDEIVNDVYEAICTKRIFIDFIEKHKYDNPHNVYCYATFVLVGAFPEGEKVIAKSPVYSYLYSQLIDKRFTLGEPAIKSENRWWNLYTYVYGIDDEAAE